jgi:rare lipoprotein A
MKKRTSLCFISLFLTACSHNNRYQYSEDHAPSEIPPLEHIEDVSPRYEPYSRGGNRNYTVRGIHYEVHKNITELTAQGIASWYGNKFHGHLTSNGERYNMFAMSAAHKQLPLPSYVQVTNLENNKQIIVRVNDRGPFHNNRIIDLSYAAAKKLDMLEAGTAKVEIKLLHFTEEQEESISSLVNNQQQQQNTNAEFHIQYLVTSSAEKAALLTNQVIDQYKVPTFFEVNNNLYYLRIGPLNSQAQTQAILESLQKGYPNAYILPPNP